MMKRPLSLLLAAVAVLAFGAVAYAASGSQIPNGDFEKGSFSGWSKKSTGGGEWSIYTAKQRKLPGPPDSKSFAPKPFGKYASVLKQENPSTNYLTHVVSVPNGATNLTVKLFWINNGSPPGPNSSAQASDATGYWRFPGQWDISGPRIQYFMLDLVKASASGFTTKNSDILGTLFKPKKGSTPARSGGWITESINVSRFQGGKIKLRLVEADNSGTLNVGLDELEFRSASSPTG